MRRRRMRRRIGTGEPSRQHALISRPEKARGHGRSPSSSWSRRRPVLRARRRWCSCPRPRVSNAPLAAGRGARRGRIAAGTAGTAAPASRRRWAPDPRAEVGGGSCARGGRARRPARRRRPPCQARTRSLALLRFGLGDPSAPGDAERAYRLALTSGNEEQQHEARWTLGHVLVWSVETERARDLFESQDRYWRERNERVAEGRAGTCRWSS